MEKTMKCILCSSKVKTLNEDVYCCISCGHNYRDYKGNGVEFHKEEYRKIYKHNAKSKRTKYANNLLNYIKPFLDKTHNCLDVGSAECVITQIVSRYVNSVDGCEVHPSLIQIGRGKNIIIHDSDFLSLNIEKKYDIVYLFDVLEHLRDLYSFKKQAIKYTKRLLIIQVPTDRRMPSPNNTSFDGHFHYFSDKSLKDLLSDKFKLLLDERVGNRVFSSGKAWLTVWRKNET